MEAEVVHVARIDEGPLVNAVQELYRGELVTRARSERGSPSGRSTLVRLSRAIADSINYFKITSRSESSRIWQRIQSYRPSSPSITSRRGGARAAPAGPAATRLRLDVERSVGLPVFVTARGECPSVTGSRDGWRGACPARNGLRDVRFLTAMLAAAFSGAQILVVGRLAARRPRQSSPSRCDLRGPRVPLLVGAGPPPEPAPLRRPRAGPRAAALGSRPSARRSSRSWTAKTNTRRNEGTPFERRLLEEISTSGLDRSTARAQWVVLTVSPLEEQGPHLPGRRDRSPPLLRRDEPERLAGRAAGLTVLLPPRSTSASSPSTAVGNRACAPARRRDALDRLRWLAGRQRLPPHPGGTATAAGHLTGGSRRPPRSSRAARGTMASLRHWPAVSLAAGPRQDRGGARAPACPTKTTGLLTTTLTAAWLKRQLICLRARPRRPSTARCRPRATRSSAACELPAAKRRPGYVGHPRSPIRHSPGGDRGAHGETMALSHGVPTEPCAPSAGARRSSPLPFFRTRVWRDGAATWASRSAPRRTSSSAPWRGRIRWSNADRRG